MSFIKKIVEPLKIKECKNLIKNKINEKNLT